MPKISTYPSATALTGSEILLGDQGGATKTMTPLQINTYSAGAAMPAPTSGVVSTTGALSQSPALRDSIIQAISQQMYLV